MKKEEYIYWAELPVRKESSRMAKFMNPFYEDALKKNLTNDFFAELRIISKSKSNLIMSCFGPQRYGKSYTMLYIQEKYAKEYNKPLSIDSCAFTITDCLKVAEKAKSQDIITLDEQIYTSGYGSTTERRSLENVEMVVGKLGLSFFFIAPKFVRHNFHYFLEVWQMGSEKQWDFEVPIEKQWKYTKSILFNHKGYMLGYIVTSTPKNQTFLKLYEEKKDKFIDEVKSGRGGGRHKVILDRAFDLLSGKIKEMPDFFERYIVLRTKRLKYLLIRVALRGEMLSIEEMRTLVDYCDYTIEFEEKFKEKRRAILDGEE